MYLSNSGSKEDYSEGSGASNKLRIQDLPFTNSQDRIILLGSNNHNDPWRLEIPSRIANTYFNMEVMNEFIAHLHKQVAWGKWWVWACRICQFVNHSPAYLILQRIIRVQKANALVKVIDSQMNISVWMPDAKEQVSIFKKDQHCQLKYTITSDKSKVFLDIVEKKPNQGSQLGISGSKHSEKEKEERFDTWELPFPQKFIIFGNGTYNQPFKMEIRDPSLIKLIDYLKDKVPSSTVSEGFRDHFPEYLSKFSKSSSERYHAIELYFSWLNINLKTLSRNEPLGKFLDKWEAIITQLVEGANTEFLRPNGFLMKLKLELMNEKKSSRYLEIIVPLGDQRDSLTEPKDKTEPSSINKFGNFYYRLLNSEKTEMQYELFLVVEKLKIGAGHRKEIDSTSGLSNFVDLGFGAPAVIHNGKDQNGEELMEEDDLLRNRHREQLRSIKNSKKRAEIIKNQELAPASLDYNDLEITLRIKIKKYKILGSIKNFLYWLVYTHSAPKRSHNYLVVLILMLMVIEIVYHVLLFWITSSGFEAWMSESEKDSLATCLYLELLLPLPFTPISSFIMGMLSYFTNWAVKIGKMYVSSKTYEILSNSIWIILWGLKEIFIDKVYHYKVVLLMLPKLGLNVLIGYWSSKLVSRAQSSKTMHKILDACNLKLN